MVKLQKSTKADKFPQVALGSHGVQLGPLWHLCSRAQWRAAVPANSKKQVLRGIGNCRESEKKCPESHMVTAFDRLNSFAGNEKVDIIQLDICLG